MLHVIIKWIVKRSYHIFGCIVSIGTFLIITQKIIEKWYQFQFKTSHKPDHLIIIQHGFLAPWLQSYPSATYISKIASKQTKSYNNNGYLIHVIRANSSDYLFGFYSTCNGIKTGASRTCTEIKNILNEHRTITKISLIGSSLGGLYIREVVKQLFDHNNKCLYRNLIPMNFITLATPHLGVAKKINHILVKLAKIAHFCCLLPTTVSELLGFGTDPLLKQMAKNPKYLKPLELFENKVLYANTINDSRVSASSGLILPSFEYENEENYMKKTYLEDIEYSRSNKKCIIRPYFYMWYPENENNLWYSEIMDDSMKWNRFVVSMNSTSLSRYFAHELLSHPIPSINDCQPVLEHLSRQFHCTRIHGFVGLDWKLLAHGSDRFIFDSSSSDYQSWKAVTNDPFHLVNWESPFDDAIQPVQAGAVMHRPSDGKIHVMLAGNDYVHLGSEWPGGGSQKAYGPPIIWEIDPKNGMTTNIYNLSDYGEAFYSSLRYTPTGDLTVAVCNGNSNTLIQILIIDQITHQVTYQHKSQIEPMLLQVTNTDPVMLLYAGMNNDGYLNFTSDGNMSPTNHNEIINDYISAIIFGADGKTIYNNGFRNEDVGIYRLYLPFQSDSKPENFIPDCSTLPWLMASDSNGNMFASCSSNPYSIQKFDMNGKSIWKSSVTQITGYTYPWITIDDTEQYIIFGTNNEWVVFIAETGELKWSKSISDLKERGDDNLFCYNSAQPWSNRHPVLMPDGKLVILCYTSNNGYNLRALNIEDGSLIKNSLNVGFNVSMVSADSNAIYLWGYSDAEKHIAGQRIPM